VISVGLEKVQEGFDSSNSFVGRSVWAPPFQVGECILVRIPLPRQAHECRDVDPETPTSDGRSPQHFAFIRSIQCVSNGWLFEVSPIVSFSSSAGDHQMNDAAKETLIPLPAFSHQHLTAALFGDPLTIGGCSTPRPPFLHIVPRTFVIGDDRPVRVQFSICRPQRFRSSMRLVQKDDPSSFIERSTVQTYRRVL
jgi:hypothetical protein